MTKVPESVLIKRRAVKELSERRAKARSVAKAKRKTRQSEAFKRAETYIKEYKATENELIRSRRLARNTGNFFREPEAKLAFVIRIRGIIGVPPKQRKILQLLRLRQIHNGVFIKLNSATIQMLRLVEPYVAYGYPSLKSVRDLLYKRGHGRVADSDAEKVQRSKKSRVALTDNALIEKELGWCDVLCMEDIVHEIFTVGKNFKDVNSFLTPFKLSSPNGGFKKKLNHFNEGGDAGNRGEEINALIKRMI